MYRWQEYPRSKAVFFSWHSIKHMILICPIADEVHFDPLIKMVSARLLSWEVTFFLFNNIILRKKKILCPEIIKYNAFLQS